MPIFIFQEKYLLVKIIHTSDWHLGQSFFTKSRRDEHQAFIDWLLAVVKQHQVDAVIIAGDVFDTGSPPSYARELYYQFVVALQSLQCTLVVLGGNHDSVAMLNEAKPLLHNLGAYVVASNEGVLDDQLIELTDRDGRIAALLCAVPFLRPRDLLRSRAGDSGQDKRQALADAIEAHYRQLYALAEQRREQQQLAVPIIATGHLSALGVQQSDSVRDIYIGTLDGFSAAALPPADYVALGHIHRPQQVAQQAHIRYSGSPLVLSFDELNTSKQVVLVEFQQRECHAITPLNVPCFQPMAVLSGSLAELATAFAEIAAQPCAQVIWLSVEVATEDYLPDLQQRVQALAEGLPVEILQLRRQRNPKRQLLTQQQRETLAELTPKEVFATRLAMERFDGPELQAQRERLQDRFAVILAATQQQEGEK